MAEAKVYERRRVGQLNIPRIDFAAERSLIQSQKQMANDLASMNKFVFGQLEGVVKERAKRYGVENAPGLEQLEDIYNYNRGIEDARAIPEDQRTEKQQDLAEQDLKKLDGVGDSYSVFGKTAKAFYLDSASKTIETLAKKEILSLITLAEQNDTPYADIKDQLQDVVDGYTETLADQDQFVGKLLNSELSLFAYSQGQDYARSELAKLRDKKKAEFTVSTELFFEGLANEIQYLVNAEILSKEGIKDKDGKVVKDEIAIRSIVGNKRINDKFASIIAQMPGLGFKSPAIRQMRDDFNKSVLNSQMIVIKKHMLENENPEVLVNNIKKAAKIISSLTKKDGTLRVPSDAQKKQLSAIPKEVVNALVIGDSNDTLDILKAIRDEKKAENEYNTSNLNMADKIRKESSRRKNNQFFNLSQTITPDNENDIFNQMEVLLATYKAEGLDTSVGSDYQKNVQALENLKAGIPIVETATQLDTEIALVNDLNRENPEYNTADINLLFSAGTLTRKAYQEYSKLYQAQGDKNFKEAQAIIRARMGIPTNAIYGAGDLKKGKLAIYKRFESQLLKEREKFEGEGTFDAVEWVNANIDGFTLDTDKEFYGEEYAELMDWVNTRGGTKKAADQMIEKFIRDGDQEQADLFKSFNKRIADYNKANPRNMIPGWEPSP